MHLFPKVHLPEANLLQGVDPCSCSMCFINNVLTFTIFPHSKQIISFGSRVMWLNQQSESKSHLFRANFLQGLCVLWCSVICVQSYFQSSDLRGISMEITVLFTVDLNTNFNVQAKLHNVIYQRNKHKPFCMLTFFY